MVEDSSADGARERLVVVGRGATKDGDFACLINVGILVALDGVLFEHDSDAMLLSSPVSGDICRSTRQTKYLF